MDQLPAELKSLLAENLSVKDIVHLCSASKTMQKMCADNRYNSLWKLKIKQDFDIDYQNSDAYLEYMRLAYTRSKIFYNVIEVGPSMDSAGEVDSVLFDTYDKAVEYILQRRYRVPEADKKIVILLLNWYGAVGDLERRFVLTTSSFEASSALRGSTYYYPKVDQTVTDLYGVAHLTRIKKDFTLMDFNEYLYSTLSDILREQYSDELYEGENLGEEESNIVDFMFEELEPEGIIFSDNPEHRKLVTTYVKSYKLGTISNYRHFHP